MCAFKFIDKVNNRSAIYRLNNNVELSTLNRRDLCVLFDHFLLQSIYNKIFERKIVIENDIHFDTSQSMGEDFQFVLDYIESTNIKGAKVFNTPLYYYIRHNSSSLISYYGFIQNENEFNRIDQLFRITGNIDDKKKCLYKDGIKKNYIYHISRNRNYTYSEKLNAISKLTGKNAANREYINQRILMFKEMIAKLPSDLKYQLDRVQNHIRLNTIKKRVEIIKQNVSANDITIISQNCIGGIVYHDLELQFCSPTINLFFKQPDFIKYVQNLKHYSEAELQMMWDEEYPVGILDDIRIDFMHYDNCREAKAAWERRSHRIIWDRILVLSTDRDDFNEDVFAEWKSVIYPKVLFTAQEQFAEDPDSVFFPEFSSTGYVGNLIPNRLFYRNHKLTNQIKALSDKK